MSSIETGRRCTYCVARRSFHRVQIRATSEGSLGEQEAEKTREEDEGEKLRKK